MLDRILDAATDNLRFAKILVQMGLDPNNVTWDAILNRLLEIFLYNITLANTFALVGAIFFVATLLTVAALIPILTHDETLPSYLSHRAHDRYEL